LLVIVFILYKISKTLSNIKMNMKWKRNFRWIYIVWNFQLWYSSSSSWT